MPHYLNSSNEEQEKISYEMPSHRIPIHRLFTQLTRIRRQSHRRPTNTQRPKHHRPHAV